MRIPGHVVNLSLCIAITGCAGLTIEAIPGDAVSGARDDRPRVGYVVYEPVIVYQKTPVKAYVAFLNDGTCQGDGYRDVCRFIGPILLPDKTRPYSLTPHVGLGKADINVQIKDGWMLSELSEKSDNTAILDRLVAPKTPKAATASRVTPASPPGSTCEGLWRWDGKAHRFVPVPI